MIFPKAKKIAIENGWYKTENTVFGIYKDYFFTIGDSSLLSNPNYKYILAKVDYFSPEHQVEIERALKGNVKELRYSTFEFQSDKYLLIFYHEVWTYTKNKRVYKMLDFLTQLFLLHGLDGMLKCHKSGEKTDLNYYVVNEEGTILCKQMAAKIEKQLFDIERENHRQEKNYFTGFLGSILFSLPGIIAWVVVAVFFSRIVAGMSLVIGFLGLQGYQFFKGKMGTYTRYILILSNIICIILSNYLTAGYFLFQEQPDLSLIINALVNNIEIKNLIFKDIMISISVSVLIWIWMFTELKPDKTGIKIADKVR